MAYEFDVEVDNKVLPFKLLEDINRWDYAGGRERESEREI